MAEAPAGPVVLLVDDDPAIRRAVAAGLELEGFSVVPASGGRAALEAATRVSPAVILLDLNMPDLDGLEVLERLRAAGDQVPVCVLSARDDATVERVRGDVRVLSEAFPLYAGRAPAVAALNGG